MRGGINIVSLSSVLGCGVLGLAIVAIAAAGPQQQPPPRQQQQQQQQPQHQPAAQAQPPASAPYDAIQAAQEHPETPVTRPEQKKTEHDLSDIFEPSKAQPASPSFKQQPDDGEFKGFDFGRDPLNAKKPMMTLKEVMEETMAAKPAVMEHQRKLLESRYDLTPRTDPNITMSRGKPQPLGPTARLPEGMTWEKLGAMSPDEIKEAGVFPYPALPHPLQAPGGFVFPQVQIQMFPRLERFDVDFDIPEAFLPEFPPAMYLQNRPELGDVSRGEVISINNYFELFKEILTPVQLEGFRVLLTPFPQEEFNPTDDRRTVNPSLGVTCFDCHINGHTTGQFLQSPDIRPQQRRFRLDAPSLRGMYAQKIHSSKRSIRSVLDFTHFEQRTAYFNGDQSRAAKKGIHEVSDAVRVNMERLQIMLDFPPAPKLTITGRLDPNKATESELRGESLFNGKAQCAVCHPPPFYLDNEMHDLRLERFLKDEPGDGPIKTFTLRGIKDSPPYLHDGRCLTLEDTVEFFNLVQELNLTEQEKADITAFLRAL